MRTLRVLAAFHAAASHKNPTRFCGPLLGALPLRADHAWSPLSGEAAKGISQRDKKRSLFNEFSYEYYHNTTAVKMGGTEKGDPF